MRLSEEQYAALLTRRAPSLQTVIKAHGFTGGKVPPKSKERNHRIEVDGQAFDSKWEYQRWQELRMQEKAGKVLNLERQIEYVLAPSVVIQGRKRPALRYYLDFRYEMCDGTPVYEDAKGKQGATDTYRIKRHLMKSVHGIDITEVRRK